MSSLSAPSRISGFFFRIHFAGREAGRHHRLLWGRGRSGSREPRRHDSASRQRLDAFPCAQVLFQWGAGAGDICRDRAAICHHGLYRALPVQRDCAASDGTRRYADSGCGNFHRQRERHRRRWDADAVYVGRELGELCGTCFSLSKFKGELRSPGQAEACPTSSQQRFAPPLVPADREIEHHGHCQCRNQQRPGVAPQEGLGMRP